MDVIEKTISNWREDICTQFAGHKIHLYYDRNNFKAYYGVFLDTKDTIAGILDCLLKSGTDIQLFLRVHFYKKWTVVRITGQNQIPRDARHKIKDMRHDCLLTVTDSDDGYVIKLAF